ncbi:HU family DNA-binding protein [Sunxiuqinia sp. A32]|uniref:HU family DNA-binding protein n=1 Tax=Sunxiuqinia sp. A32 TaxID=3461496 RepID=UPI0040462C1E
MSIKFKAVEKGQPGVVGGGEKKWYANPVMDGEMTLEDLTKSIEKISTVSGADIRAVLYALVDVSIDSLSRGTIIRVGDLGSLRVTLKSSAEEEEAKVSSDTVRKAGIIFTPGTRLKDMLKTVKFQKAK